MNDSKAMAMIRDLRYGVQEARMEVRVGTTIPGNLVIDLLSKIDDYLAGIEMAVDGEQIVDRVEEHEIAKIRADLIKEFGRG